MSLFDQAEFLASAGKESEFPTEPLPEIAIAGRSNVGKSSALNSLAGRRRLAFVSKTPGRTQTINFFGLGIAERRAAYLVDLPGYGYAKVPLALRRTWDVLAGGYLARRETLYGLMLIMDVRRPFTDVDLGMLRFLNERERPAEKFLVLLSKADKLSRNARLAALADVKRRLSAIPGGGEALLFSSLSKEGVVETRDLLESWIAQAQKTPGWEN
jgi:GTP-binding protein